MEKAAKHLSVSPPRAADAGIWPPPRDRTPHFASLNSLRFVAAITILYAHSLEQIFRDYRHSREWGMATLMVFFHMLSGFTLAYVYPAFTGSRGIFRFWLARIGRVWPVHMLVLLALAVCLRSRYAYDAAWWWNFARNVFLVQSWYPSEEVIRLFNDPAWTISTEFALYLLFPLLVWRLGSTWYIKLVGSLCIAASVVWLCNRYSVPLAGKFNISATHVSYMHPLVRMFEFVSGMVLCVLWNGVHGKYRPSATTGTFIEIAVLVICVVVMSNSWRMIVALDHRFHLGPAWNMWVERSLIPSLAMALVILIFSLNGGKISRWLGVPWMVFLGELSYGIYILQFFFFKVYALGVYDAYNLLPKWISVSLAWSSLFLSVHAVHRLVEKPARDFFRRLIPDPSAPRAPKPQGMEGSTGPARASIFRRWLPVGELATAFLLMFIVYYDANIRPHLHFIGVGETETLAARSVPEMRDIQFGDNFVLKSCAARWTPTGLQVDLVWQSLRAQPLKYIHAVHFVGEEGKLLGGMDHQQEVNGARVKAGDTWLETLTITNEQLAGVRALGFGIYEPGHSLLPVSVGERDWGGGRLLMHIPAGPKRVTNPS